MSDVTKFKDVGLLRKLFFPSETRMLIFFTESCVYDGTDTDQVLSDSIEK